jgi:hypothetical protein
MKLPLLASFESSSEISVIWAIQKAYLRAVLISILTLLKVRSEIFHDMPRSFEAVQKEEKEEDSLVK